MIRFVIVDDEIDEIKHIEKLISEVVTEDKEIISFTEVDALLKHEIQNVEMRKIYILDIELGNKMSGISLAKKIRDVDYESEIIFITNHDKMFESAHRSVYEIFDFIEKFHDFDKRLKKDLKEILKRNFDTKMLSYKGSNGADLCIFYRELLYIYRDKEERKLIVVVKHNRYKVNMSIKEMLGKLDDRFVQCHRSCIVNKNVVQEWNYKENYFTLTNGDKVYLLSNMNKKELQHE